MSTRYVIANLICFQLLWFSCVVGAGAHGLTGLAVASLVPLTLLTCWSRTRREDFLTAAAAVCFGLVTDNLWIQMQILSYPAGGMAPYWIVLLWYGLGLTVNHSLAWFRDRGWLGAVLVGLFAPLTYLAGERFGAVSVEQVGLTVIIALSWVFGFRMLAAWSARLQDSGSSWAKGR